MQGGALLEVTKMKDVKEIFSPATFSNNSCMSVCLLYKNYTEPKIDRPLEVKKHPNL